MKEMNTKHRKLVIKIISFFIAVVLWIFISYTEGSLMDVTLNSVDIQLWAEQTLIDKGLMVVDKDLIPEASVKLRGKRGDLINVMDSISASVDLSGIDSDGTYRLRPSFDIPSNAVYISKRNTLSVDIKIEEIDKKMVDVLVVQKNADKNKQYIIESVPEIGQIEVKGRGEELENIKNAVLYVDVSSVTQKETVMVEPVFEDEKGQKISFKNDIMTDFKKISVTNNAYDKKTVMVKINIPQNGNRIEIVNLKKDEINVGIMDESKKNITQILNVNNAINLRPGKQNYLFEMDIPEGIYVKEEDKFIEAEIEVYERTENLS